MLTKIDDCLERVTHTHTHTQVESSNKLGFVSMPKNIKEKYIKLVM